MTPDSSSTKLGRLLVDKDFQQVCAGLRTFNVFRALRIEHYEIRHSNVLAWLLDPEESHKLGSIFLRRILSCILLDHQGAKILPGAEIELMKLDDIEVLRESLNRDLLVVVREPIRSHGGIVLLIENKVRAGEHGSQLERYYKRTCQQFPNMLCVPVFLTPQGVEPEDEEQQRTYLTWPFARLYGTIRETAEQHRPQMPIAASQFLDHYLETLRRIVMEDDEVVQLCRKIYRRHRDALELVMEHGGTGVFQTVAAEEVQRRPDLKLVYSSSRDISFLPNTLWEKLPENSARWQCAGKRVSILYWLSNGDERIKLHFGCCQMTEKETYVGLAKAMQAAGFKCSAKALSGEAKVSRFYMRSEDVDDPTDEVAVQKAIANLLEASIPDMKRFEDVCRSYFKIR